MASFSDQSINRKQLSCSPAYPRGSVPQSAIGRSMLTRAAKLLIVSAGLLAAAVSLPAVAQQTSGNAGTGATLWAGGNCIGCHGATPTSIYQAPKNAANAGGVILNANNNFMGGLVAGAVAPDATNVPISLLTSPPSFLHRVRLWCPITAVQPRPPRYRSTISTWVLPTARSPVCRR